jgi:hypothetical protein
MLYIGMPRRFNLVTLMLFAPAFAANPLTFVG